MPEDRQNEARQKLETLCKNCGRAFSTFLQQMEEHNAKVVCPACGSEQNAGKPVPHKP